MKRAAVWAGLLVASLAAVTLASAEDEEPQQRVWTSSRVKPAPAGQPSAEGELERVLKNQEEILKKLDEIMEEVKIVKIRATLQR